MLKCSEPTYSLIGPELPFCRLLAAAAALFFSACNHIKGITSIQFFIVEMLQWFQCGFVTYLQTFNYIIVLEMRLVNVNGSYLLICSVTLDEDLVAVYI